MDSKRLIIISASQRRSKDPQPLPAIARYEGVFFAVVRKYLREGKLKGTDIIVVSDKYGVVTADEDVPCHEATQESPSFSKEALEKANRENLARLRSIFNKNRYREILVVCGKEFQRLIEGFEELTEAKIVFCEGKGLGPKALSLKQWILNR
jgi:hypothetical protein